MEQDQPNWRVVWAVLSMEAQSCLMLAFELGKSGEPFEVGEHLKDMFEGLRVLGFVSRGDVVEKPEAIMYFLEGAGYYIVLTLKELGVIK